MLTHPCYWHVKVMGIRALLLLLGVILLLMKLIMLSPQTNLCMNSYAIVILRLVYVWGECSAFLVEQSMPTYLWQRANWKMFVHTYKMLVHMYNYKTHFGMYSTHLKNWPVVLTRYRLALLTTMYVRKIVNQALLKATPISNSVLPTSMNTWIYMYVSICTIQ